MFLIDVHVCDNSIDEMFDAYPDPASIPIEVSRGVHREFMAVRKTLIVPCLPEEGALLNFCANHRNKEPESVGLIVTGKNCTRFYFDDSDPNCKEVRVDAKVDEVLWETVEDYRENLLWLVQYCGFTRTK
jgi:hypothetical protein